MRERKWFWRVGKLVLLAAVLFGIYRLLAVELRSLDWTEVARWRPSAGRLVLSLLILVVVYLAHAFLWRRIVTDLGVGRPDARTTVRVYFLASLGRYIPGKLWQLAGFAVLASRAGMQAGGATAAALLGQLAFLATGLIFVAALLPDWLSGRAVHILGALLVSSAGAIWILTATAAGRGARDWIRARIGEGPGLNAALDLADRMNGRDAIFWAVGYGLSWVALGLAFSLFATAFVPEAAIHSPRLAGSVAAAYLAGYIVLVSPAGLGVREGAMTALLATVPGFPISAAVVVAILSRVWFTIGELLPLLLVPMLPAPPVPVPASGAGPATGEGP